jgi:hypothetical protein
MIGSHNDLIQVLSSTNDSGHLIRGIVRKLYAGRARKHAGTREVCEQVSTSDHGRHSEERACNVVVVVDAASHVISHQQHLGSLLEGV